MEEYIFTGACGALILVAGDGEEDWGRCDAADGGELEEALLDYVD
jgi:hypothetical protein